MCPWEGLSPWEEWAIEMSAPGLELLTKMQNQFLKSEQGSVEEDYLAWVEDEVEVVAVQVEKLMVVVGMTMVVIKLGDEDCFGDIYWSSGEGGDGGRLPWNNHLL